MHYAEYLDIVHIFCPAGLEPRRVLQQRLGTSENVKWPTAHIGQRVLLGGIEQRKGKNTNILNDRKDGKKMKLTTGTGYGALSCQISVSKDMVFHSEVPCNGLEIEAAGYAVCRFLKHSPKCANKYIRASYRMRLASGKARRSRTCWLSGPAKALQLPGAWVRIQLRVKPEGVSVERVELYAQKGSYGNGWRKLKERSA